MKFPIITHINDLKPHVEHLPEIRFAVQPNGFTVVCAMIADNNTYSGEHAVWARECRGITFDREGWIVSRGLHKFFNVGERIDTQAVDLPWHEVVRTMDKRDGSVINPVLVDGEIQFKSKKSFQSDIAFLANKVASLSDRLFSEWCIKYGLTPTFELTSPGEVIDGTFVKARIVLKYDTSQLTLLHIRDMVSGRYLARNEIVNIMTMSGIDDIHLVDEFEPMVWNDIKDKLATLEGVEGYCIQFADGEIVKTLNNLANDVDTLFLPDRELNRKEFAIKH
jgi:RNA ligase